MSSIKKLSTFLHLFYFYFFFCIKSSKPGVYFTPRTHLHLDLEASQGLRCLWPVALDSEGFASAGDGGAGPL